MQGQQFLVHDFIIFAKSTSQVLGLGHMGDHDSLYYSITMITSQSLHYHSIYNHQHTSTKFPLTSELELKQLEMTEFRVPETSNNESFSSKCLFITC